MNFNLIVCSGADCNFSHIFILVKNLINALIFISTFLAVIAFAWAGIILLTSGGSEASKDKAKGIFKKVLIGYLWILAAWLIIYTISSVLLRPEFTIIK